MVVVVVVVVVEVVVVTGTHPEGFATPHETVEHGNWKNPHPHFTLHPALQDCPLHGPWQYWAADRQQKDLENSFWSLNFLRLKGNNYKQKDLRWCYLTVTSRLPSSSTSTVFFELTMAKKQQSTEMQKTILGQFIVMFGLRICQL